MTCCLTAVTSLYISFCLTLSILVCCPTAIKHNLMLYIWLFITTLICCSTAVNPYFTTIQTLVCCFTAIKYNLIFHIRLSIMILTCCFTAVNLFPWTYNSEYLNQSTLFILHNLYSKTCVIFDLAEITILICVALLLMMLSLKCLRLWYCIYCLELCFTVFYVLILQEQHLSLLLFFDIWLW